MKASKGTPARGLARAAVLLALAGAGNLSRAADATIPPPGFQWGPFFVAPSLATGLFVSTNPFNRPDDTLLAGEETKDIFAVMNPTLAATLPFRNSWFRSTYAGVFRKYGDPDSAPNNAQDVQAELGLRFASFDNVTIRGDYERGAADTIRFDGGEAVYDGTPYDFATYDVAVERSVAGHTGYAASVRWSQLTFDSTDVSFFEYDGWDGGFEVRKVVGPTIWLLAGGTFRRFDHQLASDPFHRDYRHENADGVQIGAQGIGGHAQVWRVMLRYDRALYPGGTGSDFHGLGGEFLLQLAPGPSSTVSVYGSRRNWSSFYIDNNYYVATLIGVRGQWMWRAGLSFGGDVNAGLNDYPDTVIDPYTSQPVKRRDWASRAELYASLAIRSALALRLSMFHQGRISNAGGVEYRADSLGLSFIFGWR